MHYFTNDWIYFKLTKKYYSDALMQQAVQTTSINTGKNVPHISFHKKTHLIQKDKDIITV